MGKVINMYVKRLLFMVGVLLLTGIAGCNTQMESVDENLLRGGSKAEEGKLVITITSQREINHFAAAVEERFPDVSLVQDIYQGQFLEYDYNARAAHGDIGDILMIKSGLIPHQDLSVLLADLSAGPIPANYNSDSLQMDRGGRIYLISGPLNFSCNIYNKTLFEENGWSVPESYEEFLALCRTIDQTGIRGCRYVFNDESMQLFNYCVRSAVDTLSNVEGQAWHSMLLAGEDVSLEPLETALLDLKTLSDTGIIREEDLEFASDMRNKSMINREQAICAAEVDALRMLCEEGTDEFRFMPHFSMIDGKGWLLNQGYYYGASNRLLEKGNEEKREAILKILSFIATEEGQQLLIEDGLGMVPSTRGAAIPDDPLLETIRPQVESGCYLVRPVYKMFFPVLSTEIAAFIRGETTSDLIISQCKEIRNKAVSDNDVLGQASEDFTAWQSGTLTAEALRLAAGADVALIGMAEINGYAPVGGNRSRLYKGPITNDDVLRVAQVKADTPLLCCRGTVTGEKLLEILEYGATSEAEQKAGAVSHFHPFAVSGITLLYDTDADEGGRVSRVKLADGKKLDPAAEYTLAYLDGALAGLSVSDVNRLEPSLAEMVVSYIRNEGTVSPNTK